MQIEEASQYQVQAILEEKCMKGKPFYRIKWKGYPVSQSTWQPIQNLEHCLPFLISWKKQKARDDIKESKKTTNKKATKLSKKQINPINCLPKNKNLKASSQLAQLNIESANSQSKSSQQLKTLNNTLETRSSKRVKEKIDKIKNKDIVTIEESDQDEIIKERSFEKMDLQAIQQTKDPQKSQPLHEEKENSFSIELISENERKQPDHQSNQNHYQSHRNQNLELSVDELKNENLQQKDEIKPSLIIQTSKQCQNLVFDKESSLQKIDNGAKNESYQALINQRSKNQLQTNEKNQCVNKNNENLTKNVQERMIEEGEIAHEINFERENLSIEKVNQINENCILKIEKIGLINKKRYCKLLLQDSNCGFISYKKMKKQYSKFLFEYIDNLLNERAQFNEDFELQA